jgi:uncharacterized protein
MNVHSAVTATEAFVKAKLSSEGTGHDWWHVDRVVNAARTMHATEGGDWLTIHLALLLHDVGDRKVINQPNDDYSIAEDFLNEQKVDHDRINHVMHIIKTMSFSKSFDDSLVIDKTIEWKIVQDADRLDAIGAIGVARAFAYGGSKSRLLYNPEYIAEEISTTEQYKNIESSTLHHFYEKLFLLKDSLNTDTALAIAAKRDAFMHQFVDQFLDEWNGKE